eukprot:3807984-Pyramimonas_sp.AAC.1
MMPRPTSEYLARGPRLNKSTRPGDPGLIIVAQLHHRGEHHGDRDADSLWTPCGPPADPLWIPCGPP